MEATRYALNTIAVQFHSCKHGTALMTDIVDDFCDVFFCLETNMWHLAHINGMTSNHGYFSKVHAIMDYNYGAVQWVH